jgi:hypothetical protein
MIQKWVEQAFKACMGRPGHEGFQPLRYFLTVEEVPRRLKPAVFPCRNAGLQALLHPEARGLANNLD